MKKTMGNGQWTMSKRRTAGLVLAIVFFVHCPLSIAHAYAFTRNLSLGAQGEDVRQLQIVLNSNPQTQVSYSGVGSPGQETDYFGEKTHAAVVRYQNLYASKILAPLGLSKGTGSVGVSTRTHMEGGSFVSRDRQTSEMPIKTQPPKALDGIPKTQDELFEALGKFSDGEIDDESIKEFARSMTYASQGVGYVKGAHSSTMNSTTTDTFVDNCALIENNFERNQCYQGEEGKTDKYIGKSDTREEEVPQGCIDLLLTIVDKFF